MFFIVILEVDVIVFFNFIDEDIEKERSSKSFVVIYIVIGKLGVDFRWLGFRICFFNVMLFFGMR